MILIGITYYSVWGEKNNHKTLTNRLKYRNHLPGGRNLSGFCFFCCKERDFLIK